MIFDPVLNSGRLNSKVLRELEESNLKAKTFWPQKLTIWISLIESEELLKNHRMLSTKSQTMGFDMVIKFSLIFQYFRQCYKQLIDSSTLI